MVVISPRGKKKTLMKAAATPVLSLASLQEHPEVLSFLDAIKNTQHDATEKDQCKYCRRNPNFFSHNTKENFADSLINDSGSPLEFEDSRLSLPEASYPTTSVCSFSESENSVLSPPKSSHRLPSICSFFEPIDPLAESDCASSSLPQPFAKSSGA